MNFIESEPLNRMIIFGRYQLNNWKVVNDLTLVIVNRKFYKSLYISDI